MLRGARVVLRLRTLCGGATCGVLRVDAKIAARQPLDGREATLPAHGRNEPRGV